jgi:hypothetical protein
MHYFFVSSLLASSAIVALLASCVPCDHSGCKAVDDPVGEVSIVAGIAGAASSESDVVANGCQECSLSQGTMQVWAVATAVTTADQARAVVDGGEPMLEIDIDERYEQMLDPGEYLVCIGSGEACAGITVDGAVVTVHARYVYGPPSLIVFEPGSDEPRTDRIFDLGAG